MLHWFFGIPGSGKSHLAERFSQMTGIPRYEGDEFHTADDRQAIAEGMFTLERRHAQLARISAALRADGRTDALITHPLPDRVSRAQVRGSNEWPGRLVYVTAPLSLVKQRLRDRPDHHFGPELLDPWMIRHWQEPEGEDCFVIENGLDSRLLEARLNELRRTLG